MHHRRRKTIDDELGETIEDMLRPVGVVLRKRMFGGQGVYLNGVFFAIIFRGGLYFKTSAETAPYYRERGMRTFHPSPTQHLASYYEVPPDAFENAEELIRLARLSTGASPGI